MRVLSCNRKRLLDRLPAGGVGAEVGVAMGAFSKTLLKRTRPRRLHLVDAWRPLPGDAPGDPNRIPAERHEARYRAVVDRFGADPRVTIHRAPSTEAAAAFDDAGLDWVYIDAGHSFEAVLADLRAWAPKVGPHGLLLGHDYADDAEAQAMGFGVVAAVEAFTRETGWHALARTDERWPTVILARDPAWREVF